MANMPANMRWCRLGEIKGWLCWSPAGVGGVLGVFSPPFAQRHSFVFAVRWSSKGGEVVARCGVCIRLYCSIPSHVGIRSQSLRLGQYAREHALVPTRRDQPFWVGCARLGVSSLAKWVARPSPSGTAWCSRSRGSVKVWKWSPVAAFVFVNAVLFPRPLG